MSTSLSKLVKFLSERLHNDQCTDCKSKLDYMYFKDDQLIFRCFECIWFSDTYGFCNGDINKFILLLRKGVYPSKYMDSWERFDETSFPDKK